MQRCGQRSTRRTVSRQGRRSSRNRRTRGRSFSTRHSSRSWPPIPASRCTSRARGVSPLAALLEASADAHLVVVGRRGTGRVLRLLAGEVGTHVVTHAACAVAVVRAQTSPAPGSAPLIMVGYDGSVVQLGGTRLRFQARRSTPRGRLACRQAGTRRLAAGAPGGACGALRRPRCRNACGGAGFRRTVVTMAPTFRGSRRTPGPCPATPWMRWSKPVQWRHSSLSVTGGAAASPGYGSGQSRRVWCTKPIARSSS